MEFTLHFTVNRVSQCDRTLLLCFKNSEEQTLWFFSRYIQSLISLCGLFFYDGEDQAMLQGEK